MRSDKKSGLKTQVLQVVDAMLVVFAFMVSWLLWNGGLMQVAAATGWFRVDTDELMSFALILPSLYLLVPFIPLGLESAQFYKFCGRQSKVRAFFKVLQGHGIVLIFYLFLALVVKLDPHRPTLGLGVFFSVIFIWVREMLYLYWFRYKLEKGIGKQRLIMAANNHDAESWWNELGEDVRDRFEQVGRFNLNEHTVDDLRILLIEKAAEKVVFLVNDVSFEKVTKAVEECEIQGVDVWLAADFVRARICQPSFDYLGSKPMLVLSSTPSLSWALLAKDVQDRLGALILIVFTSPLWLLAYIGVKIQSPGPVIYKQERAGRYGHPFKIWKFRSMYMDADKKLEELKREQGNQMSGPVFKLDQDPRIFSFGKFIRRYSIDELPQLINVLVGDMSLVGPRPMAMYEIPEIEKSEHRRKLSIKPGITCIWQVEGRNTISDFDEWVQLDLKYIDNWSLWLDLKILLKTIPAVFFSKGAK
ncbi:MAG: sugar transferase [Akkermansiaceae bacterium]